jgi:hypothetical protein
MQAPHAPSDNVQPANEDAVDEYATDKHAADSALAAALPLSVWHRQLAADNKAQQAQMYERIAAPAHAAKADAWLHITGFS